MLGQSLYGSLLLQVCFMHTSMTIQQSIVSDYLHCLIEAKLKAFYSIL